LNERIDLKSVSKSVSDTAQKQAKNEQFGRKIFKEFIDFELKNAFPHHPEIWHQNYLIT